MFNGILENQLDRRSCLPYPEPTLYIQNFSNDSPHNFWDCMWTLCLSMSRDAVYLSLVTSKCFTFLTASLLKGWLLAAIPTSKKDSGMPWHRCHSSLFVVVPGMNGTGLGLVLLWNCAKQHQAMSTFRSFHNTAWHGLKIAMAVSDRFATWACCLNHLHVWNQGYPQHVKLSWCWS